MLRKLGFFAVLVLLIAAVYASAASIGVQGGAIQVGVDGDTRCDDFVKVEGWGLEIDDDTVRYVTIGDISETYVGNTMFVQVFDTNGTKLYQTPSKPEPVITGATFKFPFPNPYLKPENIGKIKVYIEGAKGN